MAASKCVCLWMLLAGSLGVPGVPAQQVAGARSAASPASMGAASSSSTSGPDAPSAVVAATAPQPQVVNRPKKRVLPFSKFAISTKSSTLGAGGQIATPLTRWLNIRGGADFFNFGYAIGIDGASYEGQIHLKDGQVSVDYFPFGNGFHISPGFLVFKSAFSASVYVPGGNSFDLGNDTYTSSATDPVLGDANVAFTRTIMPALTIGVGNMIAKEGKHWSVPFEVGAAYTGHYTVQLALRGSACVNAGCMSTSSPIIQQSLMDEEEMLNESAKHYQLYPIINSGLSYRF